MHLVTPTTASCLWPPLSVRGGGRPASEVIAAGSQQELAQAIQRVMYVGLCEPLPAAVLSLTSRLAAPGSTHRRILLFPLGSKVTQVPQVALSWRQRVVESPHGSKAPQLATRP